MTPRVDYERHGRTYDRLMEEISSALGGQVRVERIPTPGNCVGALRLVISEHG